MTYTKLIPYCNTDKQAYLFCTIPIMLLLYLSHVRFLPIYNIAPVVCDKLLCCVRYCCYTTI